MKREIVELERGGREYLATKTRVHSSGSFKIGALFDWKKFNADTTGVAVADFDGDGHADVIALDSASDDFTSLLGNGDGTLRTGKFFQLRGEPMGVTVADFNNDNRIDFAIASAFDDNATVLLNNTLP